MLNIPVESSYNFNLCSLIAHVNVTLQERQNLLLMQRAKTKAYERQLLRRYQGEWLVQNQCFFIHNFHHWGWLVSSAVVFLGRHLFEILQRKICSRTTGSCFCSDTTENPLECIRNRSVTKQQVTAVCRLISVLYRLQINTFIFVIFFLSFDITTQ